MDSGSQSETYAPSPAPSPAPAPQNLFNPTISSLRQKLRNKSLSSETSQTSEYVLEESLLVDVEEEEVKPFTPSHTKHPNSEIFFIMEILFQAILCFAVFLVQSPVPLPTTCVSLLAASLLPPGRSSCHPLDLPHHQEV